MAANNRRRFISPLAGAMSLFALSMAVRGFENPGSWIIVPGWIAFGVAIFFLGGVIFNRGKWLYSTLANLIIWPIVVLAALVGIVASVVIGPETVGVHFWPLFVLAFVWLALWGVDAVLSIRKHR